MPTAHSLLSAACLLLAFASAAIPGAAALSPTLQRHAAARNEGLPSLAVDLTEATIVAVPGLTGPRLKAVRMLGEEIERRTLVTWPVRPRPDDAAGAAVVVGTFDEVRALLGPAAAGLGLREADVRSEGYQIVTRPGRAPQVVIAGRDARGVLFGIGHLLRQLHCGPARAGLTAPLDVVTSPHYPLRGHQLGYRPKPNAYSGWDVPQWERYIRDLVLFGCNAIEVLPPRTDDLPDSPHFPRPQLEMMAAMSQLAADYGLDVWIWYPALDDDYGNPATVAAAVAEWGEVFRALPRVDAVLVPGGDPGHTPAPLLFPLLERQAANLRRYHPQATLWLAPQGFKGPDMDYFFRYLSEQKPAWLKGAVFAPWIHMELAEFRRRVPESYPIRYYPDITHTKECQYPVPDWDPAFALTMGREPICPRPDDMALILRLLQPHTIGAVTYSEGVNDDVNKALWSALSWNPDADVDGILRDYARTFISERLAEDFARGLRGLERNWRGRLAENAGVDDTLRAFQDMERRALPADLRNWRFQSALYRAYSDAYVRARLRNERRLEAEALAALAAAPTVGAAAAMERAAAILQEVETKPVATGLRTRIYQLAEALFQSINYKSSVPLYRATNQRRGATLDTIDYPLNNRLWLDAQFTRLRALDTEAARLAGIAAVVNWTDPGPGGFYDDLGNVGAQPRLQPGVGHAADPAFIRTPLNAHFPADGPPLPLRTSWVDYIWGLNDLPITLHYPDLDPAAEYQVRVVYPKFRAAAAQAKVRLRANGDILIHDYLVQPSPVEPLTFDLPRAATQGGQLTLTWNREIGAGGSGKGCDISEVWLIKKPARR
ncbi:MAG: hypothetical protein JNG83_07560 [Opitutaceae bacterium]|nr:hypothetical protein [Opitutaceae bacterium]